MKPQEIGIKHEALSDFTWKLDEALQAVSRTMMRKGMQSGTVSAKIEIEIREIQMQDGEIVKMMSENPDIRLKIESKEQFKCDKVGAMFANITREGTVIAGDCQISMEEYMADQKGA